MEDYRPEEEVEEECNAGDNKSLFAPSDGTSFSADSFLQLNLSRPLLQACEVLGYAKPTPIQ
ncbi:DEAD-box ATP-dependent RNA helicase 28-like, partial [Trifolium medium]|nr:DEAD-box ATP-dependent RNA helicase 28-like [Trifolium medium]